MHLRVKKDGRYFSSNGKCGKFDSGGNIITDESQREGERERGKVRNFQNVSNARNRGGVSISTHYAKKLALDNSVTRNFLPEIADRPF